MQRLLQEQYRLHLTALFTPLLDVFFHGIDPLHASKRALSDD